MESLQLFLNLRWAGAKGDGSQAPIKSLTQIKDSRFVYEDDDNTLLVVVECTEPLNKVVSSSGQSSVTNSYSCEVCHKFEGDGKSMRQHQAGHDLQTKEEWMELYTVMKSDFPCMLCGVRESHGAELCNKHFMHVYSLVLICCIFVEFSHTLSRSRCD